MARAQAFAQGSIGSGRAAGYHPAILLRSAVANAGRAHEVHGFKGNRAFAETRSLRRPGRMVSYSETSLGKLRNHLRTRYAADESWHATNNPSLGPRVCISTTGYILVALRRISLSNFFTPLLPLSQG